MEIEIYRIAEKDGTGFKEKEVCRACVQEEIKKGLEAEFDNHLSKYIYNDSGTSYYCDGKCQNEC